MENPNIPSESLRLLLLPPDRTHRCFVGMGREVDDFGYLVVGGGFSGGVALYIGSLEGSVLGRVV